MGRKTVLHDLHVALGARMVDFGGWDMPVNYGSQIEEHHRVRREAGVFDVSHMCVVDLRGAGVRRFLSRLLANDVGKLWKSGKALYSCMLNDAGGVIDDLIVYYQGEQWWRIVVNAGTRDKDLAWMRRCASEWQAELSITERTDLAIVAVQGPQARTHVASLLEVQRLRILMRQVGARQAAARSGRIVIGPAPLDSVGMRALRDGVPGALFSTADNLISVPAPPDPSDRIAAAVAALEAIAVPAAQVA